jgi:hypothetical protein
VSRVDPVVEGLSELEHAEQEDEEQRQNERKFNERRAPLILRSSEGVRKHGSQAAGDAVEVSRDCLEEALYVSPHSR